MVTPWGQRTRLLPDAGGTRGLWPHSALFHCLKDGEINNPLLLTYVGLTICYRKWSIHTMWTFLCPLYFLNTAKSTFRWQIIPIYIPWRSTWVPTSQTLSKCSIIFSLSSWTWLVKVTPHCFTLWLYIVDQHKSEIWSTDFQKRSWGAEVQGH